MRNQDRIGRTVRILGGMKEFVGELATVSDYEGGPDRYFRLRLHRPVDVPGVGMVEDDLWQRSGFKLIRER
jgi:hypothetical protein